MGYLLVFSLILAIALFFRIILHFKMEEAVFLTMGLILVLLTIFGIVRLMNVGNIVICILALLALTSVILVSVKKRPQIDLASIVTPGVGLMVVSMVIYYILSRNSIVYIWDEASCYATAARYMHMSHSISNGGFVTIWTYFFTSIIGYSEHVLFVSRWMFIWVCLILPLSHLKWDRWYMALVYGVLSYGVITIIDPETQYLMDSVVGVSAGCGVAYLAVARKEARGIVLTATACITILVKDNIGLILVGFMTMFFAVYYFIEARKTWKLSKKNFIDVGVYIASIIAILFAKRLIVPVDIPAAIAMFQEHKLKIALGLVLLIIFAITWMLWLSKWVVAFREYIKKKQAVYKWYKIAVCIFAPLFIFAVVYKGIWAILYTLDAQLKRDFVYVLSKYFKTKYFGISLHVLALGILILTLFAVLTIINKKKRSSFVAQVITVVSCIGIYSLIIGLLYIKVYHRLLVSQNMMGMERYMGSVIIMVLVWLMSILYCGSQYFVSKKKQYFAALFVSLVMISCMPTPGELFFNSLTNNEMNAYKLAIKPTAQEHAKIINQNTPDDAKVLILAEESDESDFSNAATRQWIHYYIVPRPLPGMSRVDNDFTYNDLLDKLVHYDYIYIGYGNDALYNSCSDLFGRVRNKTKALYRVDKENQSLELIYVKE